MQFFFSFLDLKALFEFLDCSYFFSFFNLKDLFTFLDCSSFLVFEFKSLIYFLLFRSFRIAVVGSYVFKKKIIILRI